MGRRQWAALPRRAWPTRTYTPSRSSCAPLSAATMSTIEPRPVQAPEARSWLALLIWSLLKASSSLAPMSLPTCPCLVSACARLPCTGRPSWLWPTRSRSSWHKDAAAWLRHTPGEELALVEALLASLRGAPSVDLCHRAGLSQEQVDGAARLLTGRTPSVILYGERLGGSEHGRDVVAALNDLATALGATAHSLAVEANAQGARDMGVTPRLLPGARLVSDVAARQDVAALWGVATLPDAAWADRRRDAAGCCRRHTQGSLRGRCRRPGRWLATS